MKIFIGPDSLKGSISASKFCQIASQIIQDHWPEDEVIAIPLADGGEGTVEALVEGRQGRYRELTVASALGIPIVTQYGLIDNDTVAVIEMASASGLPLVPHSKRNPMKTTTYGTGEMILDALKLGCKKIIIGIGGSATNDAGLGMMQALGFKCIDNKGREIPFGGEGLIALSQILPPADPLLCALIHQCEILVACDVSNPLSGPQGSAHVYAPQKGADQAMVQILDQGLKNFSDCVLKDLNVNVTHLEGGGAAGGLGAGLFASLNAKLMPGFEIIRQLVDLDKVLQSGLDLVITAEGQMNEQSLNGKLPVELAKLAKSYGLNTIAIVGSREISFEEVKNKGLIGVFPIVNGPINLEEAIENANNLIQETLIHVLSLMHQ